MAEEVADLLDALDEALVEDVGGGQAGVEALLGEARGVLGLAVDHGLLHLCVELVGHWGSSLRRLVAAGVRKSARGAWLMLSNDTRRRSEPSSK